MWAHSTGYCGELWLPREQLCPQVSIDCSCASFSQLSALVLRVRTCAIIIIIPRNYQDISNQIKVEMVADPLRKSQLRPRPHLTSPKQTLVSPLQVLRMPVDYSPWSVRCHATLGYCTSEKQKLIVQKRSFEFTLTRSSGPHQQTNNHQARHTGRPSHACSSRNCRKRYDEPSLRSINVII